jgi:hypothetical protein
VEAAAAALSLLQQCSSPKVFFKKFTLQNEALRETREEMLKLNFNILEFCELLKTKIFILPLMCLTKDK